MSAATGPVSSSAASAAGGAVAVAPEPGFLAALKNRAEESFQTLQEAASGPSPADGDELALWDCVRKNILDDSKGRAAGRQFLRRECKYHASKDEVLRLERLIAQLAPGEAQDDDLEDDRAELEDQKRKRDAALDDLRPVRLSLLKSVLASAVCMLGTEMQPSALFTEQADKARLLPEGQRLKHMQDAIKETATLCWQAHEVSADKAQAALVNELAGLSDEDADLKLLRPAFKWPTSWCVNEFKPAPKAKPPKPAPVPDAVAPTRDSASPAAASVTLADVTAPMTQKPVVGKSARTELNVAVKVTCEKLCAGRLIRIKAADCVVGGEIAYFEKQDGKKVEKREEAKRGECVTVVVKVMHQPGLLISEKPHTDTRITAVDDDDHSRWLLAPPHHFPLPPP